MALTVIYRRVAEDVLRACATAGHGRWQESQVVLDRFVKAHHADPRLHLHQLPNGVCLCHDPVVCFRRASR